MKNKYKILLAEDEPNFGAVLTSYLKLANYEVDWCKNGKEAYSKIKSRPFDLFILDVMMPEMDGFTLANEIRKQTKETPLIFLTAKALKEDVLKGFELGADDYLTKPFDSDILLEKIKVLLKRRVTEEEKTKSKSTHFTIGDYSFNYQNRQLKYKEEVNVLSPKEAELLKELCKNKNMVLLRSEALTNIWGDDNYFTARSMDVYVAKLRKFLAHDEKISIVNIHGNGFELTCPE